ncbi:fibrillin-1-like isoform X2, partial [Paramuricea clavata]
MVSPKDIDECSTGRHSCGSNTRCQNNPGSYSCPCISGFKSTSSLAKSCQDIDECNPSSGMVHGCQM